MAYPESNTLLLGTLAPAFELPNLAKRSDTF